MNELATLRRGPVDGPGACEIPVASGTPTKAPPVTLTQRSGFVKTPSDMKWDFQCPVLLLRTTKMFPRASHSVLGIPFQIGGRFKRYNVFWHRSSNMPGLHIVAHAGVCRAHEPGPAELDSQGAEPWIALQAVQEGVDILSIGSSV